MKRLCFLSPNVYHAQSVVSDLKKDGISEKHIYAIARHDTPLDGLPDGGPDDDDFLPALERGIALGGGAGIFAGLLALAFPPAGFVIGGGAVLLVGMMGASLGGLMAGMAGAAFPSSRLADFEKDLEAGCVLVMVDVPEDQISHVNTLIRRLDPEVIVEGVEPPAPIVPR